MGAMTNVSTINPNIPTFDSPVSSGAVRGNFEAAYSDINIIYGLIAGYQALITLTTTGTSGAATLINNVLNIPQYSGGGTGITWNEVTTTSQSLAIANGYVMNNASQVIGTLPASAVFGSVIRIVGKGAGGWKVTQNAGQTIHFDGNNTTTGTGGSLNSQSTFDCIDLLCITANTDWVVTSSIGNITGV